MRGDFLIRTANGVTLGLVAGIVMGIGMGTIFGLAGGAPWRPFLDVEGLTVNDIVFVGGFSAGFYLELALMSITGVMLGFVYGLIYGIAGAWTRHKISVIACTVREASLATEAVL